MKRGFLKSVWFVLTLTCDDSSRLLSDAMDRDLTRFEKLALRMHNLSCKSCKRFTKQLGFLRKSAPSAVIEDQNAGLPSEAKKRLKKTLQQASAEDE